MSRADAVRRGFEREFSRLPHVFPASCEGESCEGGCPACEHTAEFSSQHCEVCSALPGARYPLVAMEDVGPGSETAEILYFAVCEDCLMFAAYGDLPEGDE